MSGCDRLVEMDMGNLHPYQWPLHPATCDCDHGEDDPCCSETKDPQEEEETA